MHRDVISEYMLKLGDIFEWTSLKGAFIFKAQLVHLTIAVTIR